MPGDQELHCPYCGYNLRGLPERRCPECGRAFDPDRIRDNAVRAISPARAIARLVIPAFLAGSSLTLVPLVAPVGCVAVPLALGAWAIFVPVNAWDVAHGVSARFGIWTRDARTGKLTHSIEVACVLLILGQLVLGALFVLAFLAAAWAWL